MGMYLSLAWRNIWRNKRRSLITASSVLLAVVLAVLTRGFQLGFYEKAIDNVVSFYTGYLQVQAPGYWDSRTLDKSLELTPKLNHLTDHEGVTAAVPRLETFALISVGSDTKGTMIIGVDPEREPGLTALDDKVSAGRYFESPHDGMLLAEGLAAELSCTIGDTVVVLGQGYHGIMAAGKFAVVGLLHFPSPEMNNAFAFLTLTEAQALTGAEGRVTAIACLIDDQDQLNSVAADLRHSAGDNLVVMTWDEMLPELVQLIQTDNASGLIMLFVIYLVIGFGILGTILMMTVERTREFGMLMAVGMKRARLGVVILLESIMLSLLGVVTGAIVAIPFMLYFHYNPLRLTGEVAELTEAFGFEPVMPVSLDPMIFVSQAILVLAIALIASGYPWFRIGRLHPVKAMRTA